MQKTTKQSIYRNIFCTLVVDYPQLFNPFTPKPLSFNIASQLYYHYDKKLSPECIQLFLGRWTNRFVYHKSILREDYRVDLFDQEFKISDSHKKHAFHSVQQMLII